MDMTTYAPNWTPRYKAGYKVVGINHTMTMRMARGTNAAGIVALATVMHDFVTALADRVADDFTWLDASYALTDSDVFVPTDPPATVAGEFDPINFSTAQRITATTFTGRAASGRARVSLYGVVWAFEEGGTPGNDFIVHESEAADIGDAVDVLQAGAIANSGEVTIWHRNATIKINDGLVKKVRQGVIS